MSDPFAFASTTPRHALPNLFAAQAQKEFTVNEAFALIDALLHIAAEGEASEPPASPADGECWIVGAEPSGEWSGQAGAIACRQGGTWLFLMPSEGLTLFDKAAGCTVRFADGWHRATPVALPDGGSTIDAEARTAIADIVGALESLGILPDS
tara:strand:+ start:765 stop:1223 length:459 start_codon:yes stop_codon:yes gene_type:complete